MPKRGHGVLNNYEIRVKTSRGVVTINGEGPLVYLSEYLPVGAAGYDGSNLSLCDDGARFTIDSTKGPLEGGIDLENWQDFLMVLAASGASISRVLALKDEDAASVFMLYGRFYTSLQVTLTAQKLRRGEVSIADLKSDCPAVLDRPEIKQVIGELAISGALPTAKKRPKLRKEEFELQALVAFKRRRDATLSLEDACAAACEERPEWVPATWKTSPDSNLARQISRVWSKTRWGFLHHKDDV